MEMEEVEILKRITGDNKIYIAALDGTQTIADSPELFGSYLDLWFKEQDNNKPGPATVACSMDIYEIAQKSNFRGMLGSLNSNLDELVSSQAQLVYFCRKYPHKLHKRGYYNFFLMKDKDGYYIATVTVRIEAISIYRYDFEREGTWNGKDCHHLLIPCPIAA